MTGHETKKAVNHRGGEDWRGERFTRFFDSRVMLLYLQIESDSLIGKF